MMTALGTSAGPQSGYCNACFTGDYPFDAPIPLIELEAKHTFAGVWGD
jgi:amidophosphoribosyltransferase